MSDNFPRKSAKRPHPSFQENISFVKNVKSRMSDLLPTITQWFSKSDKSKTNGSAVTADASDTSSEEEGWNLPEPKRRRFCKCDDCGESSLSYQKKSTGSTPNVQREEGSLSSPPAHDQSTQTDINVYKSEHTMAKVNKSVATKRTSLFGISDSAREESAMKTICNTSSDLQEPCFQSSLSFSTFYPGRTTYGGAGYPYLDKPNIQHRRMVDVNKSKCDTNASISTPSKRIMDLLEYYSSPLNEARRIQSFFNKNDLSLSPSNIANKTRELHVPSLASTLKAKHKKRLMETTTAARKILASHSSVPEYSPIRNTISVPISNEKDRATTYTETGLTPNKKAYVDNSAVSPESALSPNASRAVDQDTLTKSSVSIEVVPMSIQPIDTPISSTPKFNTSEKHLSLSSSGTVTSESKLPKFTFCKPETHVHKIKSPKQKDDSINLKSKDWKCSDCWVNNKPDVNKCVCCGGLKSNDNEKTSMSSTYKADKQIGCNTKTSSLDIRKFVDPSKWKCVDCLVSNDEAADKCVCCGGMNPKVSKVTKVNQINSHWKCDVCWVNNKSDTEKCVACDGAKPGIKQPSGSASLPSYFSQSKPQENNTKSVKDGTWNCTICLVKNDNDRSKCVCCESSRPGTNATSDKEQKRFNFGTASNSEFKFGIDPAAQASNLKTNMLANSLIPANKSNVMKSETNNNSLDKTPTFTFGIKSTKADNATISNTDKEAPKLNFSFGIPQQMSMAQPTLPTFGNIDKLPGTATDTSKVIAEKKQDDIASPFANKEVDKVPNHLSKPFELPASSMSQQSKSVLESTPVNANVITEEKTVNNLVSISSLSPISSQEAVKPSFKFNMPSSPGITFGVVTTQSTSASHIIPTVAETPKLPQFQKSNDMSPPVSLSPFPKSEVTASSSLFQKPETVKTTAPTAVLPKSTVFNFSSNSVQNLADKPNFNFSFNKNVMTPIFDGTFKAANETKPPNEFAPSPNNLEAVSSLATGNQLGGNGLLTGNGLSGSGGTPNDITSSTLASGNNGLQTSNAIPASGIFGSPAQKENMWTPANNTSNLFASTSNTNVQKVPAFTFGSSTSFSANSGASPFGNTCPPSQNMFGISSPNNNPSPLFTSSVQNTAPQNLFGSPTSANNNTSALAMFGSQSAGPTPAFGSSTPTMSTFDVQPIAQAQPQPTFNFTASPATPVFGFGQQQAPQQSQQSPAQQPIYNFNSTPQVQFNMGSSANTSMRRMRKAVRRQR